MLTQSKQKARKLLKTMFLIVSVLTVSLDVSASSELGAQRERYTEAQKALRSGQLQTFTKLRDQLKDYPLYPYLQYNFLSKRLSRLPENEIQQFIQEFEDSPVSQRLLFHWLMTLVKRNEWGKFLEYYEPGGGTKLSCYRAQALYKTNNIEKANKFAEKLWLVGRSQPHACDDVFVEWKKHGGMTREHVWGRVRLAMENGRLSLANFVAKNLNKEDQTWVERWRKMYRRPGENLLRKYYKTDDPIARVIVRHGVKRLARRDSGAAADVWESLRDEHIKDAEDEVLSVDQYIALQAGLQKHPRALEWLGKVKQVDEDIEEWRIRAALAQNDWWSALTWIEALPAEKRSSDQWRYWRGRILELQSEAVPALRTASERIYAALANERSYHGFLAADRLGSAYQLNSQPLEFTKEELAEIEAFPAVQRARELFILGEMVDARREWTKTTATFNDQQLKKASVLASQWGWHDRAIITVAKASHFDDLELRFPIAHRDIITKQAQEQRVEPSWVYGVLRQESIFMPDARSHAGALGLMQLMPRTGRTTAREIKTRIRSNQDLLDITKNIRLGAAYLRRMLDQNDGNSVLATASYNAGPHRVKKWLPDENTPSDIWVETIPYGETRNYVRKVMSYTVIYDKKLEGKTGLMRHRMPEIKARGVDS